MSNGAFLHKKKLPRMWHEQFVSCNLRHATIKRSIMRCRVIIYLRGFLRTAREQRPAQLKAKTDGKIRVQSYSFNCHLSIVLFRCYTSYDCRITRVSDLALVHTQQGTDTRSCNTDAYHGIV